MKLKRMAREGSKKWKLTQTDQKVFKFLVATKVTLTKLKCEAGIVSPD